MLFCRCAPAAPRRWEQKHPCGSGRIKFPMDLGTSRLTCRSLRAPGVRPGVPHVPVGAGCGGGAGWARSRTLGVESWLPAWFLPSAKHHVADPGERRQSLLLLKYFWKYLYKHTGATSRGQPWVRI